jgi:predicted metalloprotease with PDZ domain
VLWDGPAFKAGLAEGTQIVAVDGQAYTPEDLLDAVRRGKGGAAPLALLVKTKDEYRTVTFDYHEGLRYPRLERMPGATSRLDDILAPRK